MSFLPKYVHFNGLKLSGALEEFSNTSQFLGSIFSKISKTTAHTKIIVCVLFYVNMFDQTQYSLISSFLNIILSGLVSTSGFNVKLYRSFEWHMP